LDARQSAPIRGYPFECFSFGLPALFDQPSTSFTLEGEAPMIITTAPQSRSFQQMSVADEAWIVTPFGIDKVKNSSQVQI